MMQDIAKQLKYAMVYGSSVKHSRGQLVGLDHQLAVRSFIIRSVACTDSPS